jgi:hypothetical protein
MSSGPKGKITFRIAAVFFLLSALLEIFSITSQVPLFGALRGGVSAAIYHLIYFLLFLGLGIGLWRAKPWGYGLVFAGTLLYTLDKVLYLLYRDSMKVWLRKQFSGYEEMLQFIDIGLILQMVILLMLLFVAGWWGFAVYTYWRREYFGLGQKSETPASSNK